MTTKKCDCSGRPLGTDKCPTCQSADTAKEKPLCPSDATTCSAFATIRRHKYPHEYSGWNVEHDAPKWTSDRLDAAPVPLEILVSELNKIAARETNIWAVIYPQNAKCPSTQP
jgi:hypothetical protein